MEIGEYELEGGREGGTALLGGFCFIPFYSILCLIFVFVLNLILKILIPKRAVKERKMNVGLGSLVQLVRA